MPESTQLQGIVRKAVAAVTGFLLAMVLLVALLITGFYLLVHALVLALTPWLGAAGAMGVAGFLCLLLLAVFFHRMTRPASSGKRRETASGTRSPVDILRKLIKDNPLEAVLAAFAAGVVEQGDPRLKSLLLQGGMELMKQADSGAEPEAEPGPSGSAGQAPPASAPESN
jgi:hypothetical protein